MLHATNVLYVSQVVCLLDQLAKLVLSQLAAAMSYCQTHSSPRLTKTALSSLVLWQPHFLKPYITSPHTHLDLVLTSPATAKLM